MKFLLEIQLGNDATQTGSDVAEALRRIAIQIDADFAGWDLDADQGKVYDINGNSVGTWGVCE
jgi:hypothetical protein